MDLEAENLLIDQEDDDNIMLKFFKPIKVIGRGAFSIVISAYDLLTQERVAIKIIIKNEIKKSQLDIVKKEALILSRFNHPNIVRYKMSKETTNKLFIIMEQVQGDSLETIIKQRKEQFKHFSNQEIVHIIKQLLLAIQYIHSMEIIHRDIKPENILISTEEFDDQISVKLIDFGLSFSQEHMNLATDNCGTLLYMAPEILFKNSYDEKVDIWCVGIIIYQMITLGDHPLWAKKVDNRQSYLEKLEQKKNFRVPFDMDTGSRNFFLAATTNEPKERISAKDALQHPWIQGRVMQEPMNDIIQEFQCRQRFFKTIIWNMIIKKLIITCKAKNLVQLVDIQLDQQKKNSERMSKESFESVRGYQKSFQKNSAASFQASNTSTQKKSLRRPKVGYLSTNNLSHVEEDGDTKVQAQTEESFNNGNIFHDNQKFVYSKQIQKLILKPEENVEIYVHGLINSNSKQFLGLKNQGIDKIVSQPEQLSTSNKSMRKVLSHDKHLNLKLKTKDLQPNTATNSPLTQQLKLPPLNPKLASAQKKSASNLNSSPMDLSKSSVNHITPKQGVGLQQNKSNFFKYNVK